MGKRWIKLWDTLPHSPIWRKPEYLRGWLFLILSASHKEQSLDGRILPVGSLLTSQKKLEEKCEMSRQQVRTFLKFLEKEGMIKVIKKSELLKDSKNRSTSLLTSKPTSPHFKEPTILLISNYLKFQEKKEITENPQIFKKGESTSLLTSKPTIIKKYRSTLSIRGEDLDEETLKKIKQLIGSRLASFGVSAKDFKEVQGSISSLLDWFNAKKENGYKCESDLAALRAWGVSGYIQNEIIPALRYREVVKNRKRKDRAIEKRADRNHRAIEAVTGVPLSNSRSICNE